MKKFFLTALVSSAIASTAVLASAGLVQAATCPFSKINGISDTNASNNPSSSTFPQTNSNKMGIAGASIATLAGLFVGGMVIKARLTRQNETVVAEVPQAETAPEASFDSTFAIVLPPEALTSSKVAEVSEPQLTSVR